MPSVIYAIKCEHGPVKIGTTTSVSSRLQSLQTASPFKLCLLATHPGDEREERRVHELLGGSRLNGEWFEDTPHLRSLIAEWRNPPAEHATMMREFGTWCSLWAREQASQHMMWCSQYSDLIMHSRLISSFVRTASTRAQSNEGDRILGLKGRGDERHLLLLSGKHQRVLTLMSGPIVASLSLEIAGEPTMSTVKFLAAPTTMPSFEGDAWFVPSLQDEVAAEAMMVAARDYLRSWL